MTMGGMRLQVPEGKLRQEESQVDKEQRLWPLQGSLSSFGGMQHPSCLGD